MNNLSEIISLKYEEDLYCVHTFNPKSSKISCDINLSI